ncbi:MAG: hypothetical protein V4658_06440 [Bacteroidota bacterium]
MKLEFVNNVNKAIGFSLIDAERLVRLYDFDTAQPALLLNAIQQTIIEEQQPLNLGELSFIKPVNCNMILAVSDEDTGIAYIGKNTFVCSLTLESFKKMTTLIQPFTKKTNGYQWLYELDNDIDFLFSPG